MRKLQLALFLAWFALSILSGEFAWGWWWTTFFAIAAGERWYAFWSWGKLSP